MQRLWAWLAWPTLRMVCGLFGHGYWPVYEMQRSRKGRNEYRMRCWRCERSTGWMRRKRFDALFERANWS